MDLKHFVEALDRIVEQPVSGTANVANIAATSTTLTPQQKQELAKQTTALNTMKTAVQSPASGKQIAQSLEKVSTGAGVTNTDIKNLDPYMDVLKQVSTDPRLSQTFKNLINQAKMSK